jgi:hypothetical protein
MLLSRSELCVESCFLEVLKSDIATKQLISRRAITVDLAFCGLPGRCSQAVDRHQDSDEVGTRKAACVYRTVNAQA